jgi:hypothetical protein
MHIGFTLVVLSALGLYALAALTFTTGTPQILEETLSGPDASGSP